MPDSSDNFATKQDLNDLKEELLGRMQRLATKEELDQKIAKLATRKALEVVANQVAKNTDDIVVIKYDIKELKLEMGQMREEMNEKFNMMMNAFDKIMKGLDVQRAENAAFHHAMLRHENRLDDHDHRIGKLEEAAYA